MMERKIMHIDMDAFFAAIEQLDNPNYRGLPVIVGADPKGRGVVSTCSYEARKFGVHSAMPIREAYQRCPQGIFLPVRGHRYAEVSRQIMAILADYTPDVEPLSLDEAFLDLTGSQAIFGPAENIARGIVGRIAKEIGLSASVGLAPNKFLAKLASDLKKPKGFVIITPETIHETLDNLPVSKIWGVGPKTEAQLKEMGLRTIGDVGRIDPRILSAKFGEAGTQLHRLANGLDDRPVITCEETKSIGHEITFQEDTDDSQYLAEILLWLADQVARRLRRHHLRGRVITLKLRDSGFKTLTKRTTLAEPTDFEETIYREAVKLAGQINWGRCLVRLIGVSVSDFSHPEKAVQLNLFGELEPTESGARPRGEELKKLHQAVDQLKDRFGEGIITKGTILKLKEEGKKERGLH
ncbi:MAG: DNA polymerase IV [Firmicutes bacterium]|nr:DNA polymerase IV [Bacillota bacterium]